MPLLFAGACARVVDEDPADGRRDPNTLRPLPGTNGQPIAAVPVGTRVQVLYGPRNGQTPQGATTWWVVRLLTGDAPGPRGLDGGDGAGHGELHPARGALSGGEYVLAHPWLRRDKFLTYGASLCLRQLYISHVRTSDNMLWSGSNRMRHEDLVSLITKEELDIYTWEDRADLAPGATYFYWVEDVDVNGAATMHGPVSVDFSVPTAVEVTGLAASSSRTLFPAWPAGLVVLLAALTTATLVVRRQKPAPK